MAIGKGDMDGESVPEKVSTVEDKEGDCHSHFLALPPELRNRVYRNALLTENDIPIDAQTHTDPALLLTCRQIRNEAKGIYRMETFFVFPIRNLHLALPLSHWAHKHTNIGFHGIRLGGQNNWTNLMAWLEVWHRNETWVYVPEGGKKDDLKVVARAFAIALAMREVRWSVVEEVLGHLRAASEVGAMSWV